MLSKKRRSNNNSINAGSMADIAFLLLIFFLVTTQIVEDRGLLVQLPRWEAHPPESIINENDVLTILVNAKNELMVEGKRVRVDDLKEQTKLFISNPQQSELLPKTPKQAIISLRNDRNTSYETYIEVYDELKGAYRELRDEEAKKIYNKAFTVLSKEQQKKIKNKIPLVISEAEPTDVIL